jgi:hypothetical protein
MHLTKYDGDDFNCPGCYVRLGVDWDLSGMSVGEYYDLSCPACGHRFSLSVHITYTPF